MRLLVIRNFTEKDQNLTWKLFMKMMKIIIRTLLFTIYGVIFVPLLSVHLPFSRPIPAFTPISLIFTPKPLATRFPHVVLCVVRKWGGGVGWGPMGGMEMFLA